MGTDLTPDSAVTSALLFITETRVEVVGLDLVSRRSLRRSYASFASSRERSAFIKTFDATNRSDEERRSRAELSNSLADASELRYTSKRRGRALSVGSSSPSLLTPREE